MDAIVSLLGNIKNMIESLEQWTSREAEYDTPITNTVELA